MNLPADSFSALSRQILQSDVDPSTEVLNRHWLLYGIPQIAARALCNTRTADVAADTIGWEPTGYSKVGYY